MKIGVTDNPSAQPLPSYASYPLGAMGRLSGYVSLCQAKSGEKLNSFRFVGLVCSGLFRPIPDPLPLGVAIGVHANRQPIKPITVNIAYYRLISPNEGLFPGKKDCLIYGKRGFGIRVISSCKPY